MSLTFDDIIMLEGEARKCVSVKLLYVDMCDDLIAGILLSQIAYWYSRGNNGESKLKVNHDNQMWIAKGRSDWYKETRITEYQFDRASDILVDLGIIEKKVYKFAGTPKMHVRLIKDKFVDLCNETLQKDNRESRKPDPDPTFDKTESPLSIKPKVHITENTTEKKDLSSFVGNVTGVGADIVWCSACGGNEAVDKKYDQKGRCAWCLFVDGWTFYELRGAPRHSIKAGRRVYSTPTAQRLCKKVMTRWKNEDFRNEWAYALEYASKLKYLQENTWFKPEYFLRNDENYRKIIGDPLRDGGVFDSFEKQDHPESYQRLLAWRTQRLAGVQAPQAVASSVQLAGGQSERGEKEVLFGYG